VIGWSSNSSETDEEDFMAACTGRWIARAAFFACVVGSPLRATAATDAVGLDIVGVAASALAVGLVLFTSVVTIAYVWLRDQCESREAILHREIATLRTKADRAELFLAAEPQLAIAWAGTEDTGAIEGDLGLVGAEAEPAKVLAFSSWLPARSAAALECLVSRLRDQGESFRLSVESTSARHLEITGRPVGGSAVMRIKDVSGDRREVSRLVALQAQTKQDLEAFRAMLETLPSPAWVRNGDGRLTWVNSAYAMAVEAEDQRSVVASGIELIERPAREAIALARGAGQPYRGRAAVTAAGERRTFELVEAPAETSSVGLALDLSEVETIRVALKQEVEAHARTLDQLSTAVAIFDRAQRLVFHNAAYRQLFALDQAWLDQKPTEPEILDRLRTARVLPEFGLFGTEPPGSPAVPQQADFRTFKARLLSCYRSLETRQEVWYLPDGRTLRMVANPNPQGGVTYLFDDATERYHLESRFNGLLRVQGETLDTLKEGVAVFGSDGRLKLYNPAFAGLWALSAEDLADSPHIDHVASACSERFGNPESWRELKAAVAGWQDQRVAIERRLPRRDGSVLDCSASPLPDGATLLAFIDMTASVDVERALTERNQALLEAQKLRNEFVHHVSYELRSPLNTIIGFIQFLGDPAVGTLNAKQLEYQGYVMKSSAALLALIDDILDLASIDAEIMELSLEEVDIARTIEAVAQSVQDRLAEADLRLEVSVAAGIGSFVADGKRIRQILFNLLSNAIGFSAPGQSIGLTADRPAGTLALKVSDEGRGIPAGVIEHVFERFKTYTAGSRHRGVGLGLSIVRAFVEMHGGHIEIATKLGAGTTVTCIFPLEGATAQGRQEAYERDDR
jgi:signal transduction histidine kinase